ncbi:MAG: LptA/OstA family protein, partial [Fluviibacter sp.]
MMHRLFPRPLLAMLLAAALALPLPSLADRNDSSKPMDFKSQQAHMDDLRKTYNYVGQVRMTQGTRQLTADKVVIKQAAAGFSKS